MALSSTSHRRRMLSTAAEAGGEALRRAVVTMRGGVGEAELLADLEAIRVGLDEAVEDQLLEVMDELVGWCAPHARLGRDDG